MGAVAQRKGKESLLFVNARKTVASCRSGHVVRWRRARADLADDD